MRCCSICRAPNLWHRAAELIGIVENFLPYLLGAGDFRTVAYILRETRVVLERARELIPEHRAILLGFPGRLSQPEALGQLLQSLDEATVHPSEEELTDTFSEMRPEALPTLMGFIPRLTNAWVRDLVVRPPRAWPKSMLPKC